MTGPSKSWQSRMQQSQDELAVEFVESITIDNRLYKYDIAGSIAHAQMLSEQKLITKSEFQEIKKALTEISEEIDAGKFKFKTEFEDIHMVVENALIKKTGDVGKKLHTGRSRNDQVCLDMRLWMRDEIAILIQLIVDLQKALVKLAQKQGQIVMPGYTHLQRAQPILAGHGVLVFAEQLQRDKERLNDLLDRVNVSPLGSGALAGSSLGLDRQRTAEILGFAGVTRNSIDSISDRDFCVEFIFCNSMIATHLSRLAEDWIIYMSQEFSFITIADAYVTGSSMMPQKKNPDMLELIRGKCSQQYGNLMAMLAMIKGQPLAYNRDMQEDKKQLFDSSDTIEACLAMTTAIVANTTFNKKEIAKDLDKGFLDATALAEYLVRKGVPFRQAHQIVGKIVNQCEDQNIALSELELDKYQKVCDKIESDVFDSLSPENVVKNYNVEGSAGLDQLNQQLEFWKDELK